MDIRERSGPGREKPEVEECPKCSRDSQETSGLGTM